MILEELSVKTNKRDCFVDLTYDIQKIIDTHGVKEGVCTVFVPHTTAAVTINENADPDVKRDMLFALDHAVPHENGYHHMEGNAAAHVKASMMGFSEQLIIHEGQLLLGIWQSIYFCEFDGPRNRRCFVKIQAD